MIYRIAHVVRDRMPFVWDMIDGMNSLLFRYRYGGRLRETEKRVMREYSKDGMRVVRLRDVEVERMVEFFGHQPEEAFTFFRPHGFDAKTISKLQRNDAFMAYVLMDGEHVIGYCFNRSFFHGKGFRGRMIDIDHRNRGYATMMNRILNDIGFGIGLQLYETVSMDNIASYRSSVKASRVKVIEELPNRELYLEIVDSPLPTSPKG